MCIEHIFSPWGHSWCLFLYHSQLTLKHVKFGYCLANSCQMCLGMCMFRCELLVLSGLLLSFVLRLQINNIVKIQTLYRLVFSKTTNNQVPKLQTIRKQSKLENSRYNWSVMSCDVIASSFVVFLGVSWQNMCDLSKSKVKLHYWKYFTAIDLHVSFLWSW